MPFGLVALRFAFRLLSTSALRLNFIDNIMNNFGGYPLTCCPTTQLLQRELAV